MKKKIVWLVVSCLMVLSLVLASCAPAVVEEEEVVTPVVEEEEVVEEEVAPVGPVMVRNTAGKMQEMPQYGGYITVGSTYPVIGFDPAYTVTWQCFQLVHTHDPLLMGDFAKTASGTGESGFLLYTFFLEFQTGYLAESWDISDPETIIFHLRQGVRWQDLPPVNGREFVADDVVYSFKRLFETPESYLVATHPEGRRPLSIEALDKYTVEIKVPPGTQGPIFRDLSSQTWPIAPEIVEMYGDHKDWKHSVGTGPFILTDYVPGSQRTFTKNPDYWMEDPLIPGNKLPYVDYFKILNIPDRSTRLAALRTGKSDMMAEIQWDEKDSLLQTNPEMRYTMSGIVESGIGIKTDKAPFNDIKVRRALWLAMDNPGIKDDLYNGNASLLSYPVKELPDFAAAYVPLEELPESTQELYGYDPEKAKELLAEAGYPDGFKAKLVHRSDVEAQVDMAAVLQEQWSKVGIELELEPMDYGAFTSVMIRFQHEDMILADSMWTSSPYKCQTWGTLEQARNLSRVDDSYLQGKYEEIQANFLDPVKRAAILKEVVPYILDKAWYIEPPNFMVYTLWNPWLKNYNGEYCLGYTKFWTSVFRYGWIDGDMKYEMTGKR